MKKIKNKWQVWVNALLTTIMGWLAMSCDLAPMYGPPVNLYAPPAPDPESYLVVEGKVVDEVGRPLANIRVDLKAPLLGEYVPEIYTDEQGLFAYSENCTPDLERDTLQLHFSDVYQVYASDSLKVPFVKMDEFDMIASTRVVNENDIDGIKKETGDLLEDSMRLNIDPTYQEAVNESGDGQETESDRNPKMEKITSILFIVAVVLIGLVIILLVGKTIGLLKFNDTDSEVQEDVLDMVTMIDVTGMDYDSAKKALENIEILCESAYIESEEYAEGTVIESSVKEGEEVERFSTVTLTVSSGTDAIMIPIVTGKNYEDAKSTLEKEGFVVTKATSYSQDMAAGYVLSQSPAAETKAPVGSTITLTVSLGKEEVKVRVPKVLGMTETEAINKLEEAGLKVEPD